MKNQLTTIQAKVLAAIRDKLDRGESAPTYRELCTEFGWSSTGTARDHVQALERKGYIELPGNRGHRQIRLRQPALTSTPVPLVGQVAAGVPLLAEENIEARLPVPDEWLDRRPHFAVHVTGDSMIGAGILDGDCVIVRQQATAEDGEIVVATLDGETTLKRLQRLGSRVALIAENPRYPAIEIRTDDAIIQGVVVGLLREYGRRLDSRRRSSERGRSIARHGS